ncbi:MAG: hypothetical protein LBC52_00630 [Treponema sp.]|nr:hypothetical protein [Treponema sp.]
MNEEYHHAEPAEAKREEDFFISRAPCLLREELGIKCAVGAGGVLDIEKR